MPHLRFGAAALAFLLAAGASYAQTPTISAGTIVLRDLSFAGGAFDGKLGSLEFTGLSRDGAEVTARAVKLEGLTMKSSLVDIDLPSLVITDFEGPASAVDAAMAGQLAKVDWAQFLGSSKAVRIDVPRLVYRLHDQNGEQVVTTEGLVFEDLADGRLGAMTLATQESVVTGATPEESGKSKAGTTRYDGIDVAEFVRVFVGGGSGPAKRLIDKGTSQSVEFQTGDLVARIGSTSASGFLGRAPAQPLTIDDLTRAMNGEIDKDDALRRKVVAFLRDIVTYFSLEQSGATDLEFTNADVPVTIASANFNGVGLGGFGLFELKDIGAVSPVGNFRLGRFAIENFSWQKYLDRAFAASEATAELPSPTLQELPKLGAVRLQNFESTTSQGPVAFDEISFETADGGGLPGSVSLLLKRLKLQLDTGEPADWKARLLALGYQQITADGRIVLRLDEAGKTLTIDHSGVSIDDAGSVTATVRLDGVDTALLFSAQSPEDLAASDDIESKITIGDITLEADDAGLLQRFYASVATDAGVSPDTIRDGMAAEIRSQADALLGDALTPGSAEAIGDYLRNPGKLTVHVVPRPDRPPLSLAEVTSDEPPLLADRVTISIEATK